MRRFTVILSALLLSAAMAGCSGNSQETDIQYAQASVMSANAPEIVLEADPDGAAVELLELLEDRKVIQLNDAGISEIMALDAKEIPDYLVYYSDVDSGLSAFAFVMPDDSNRDQIRETLTMFTTQCAAFYEDYDILGAAQVAKDAVVFDQGEYLVLLMLPDNSAGRDIVDRYMPR